LTIPGPLQKPGFTAPELPAAVSREAQPLIDAGRPISVDDNKGSSTTFIKDIGNRGDTYNLKGLRRDPNLWTVKVPSIREALRQLAGAGWDRTPPVLGFK
jgi:hypothetical protein